MTFHKKIINKILVALFFLSLTQASFADKGTLRVITSPENANITVNNVNKGNTSNRADVGLDIYLEQGDYQINAVKDDDGEWQFSGQANSIFVAADTLQTVYIDLVRQPSASRLARLKAMESEALEQYKVNDNGTITDNTNGLTWMQCNLGETWNGTTCEGIPDQINWESMFVQVKQLNLNGGFAGYNDWRVPNIQELYSLVNCSSNEFKEEEEINGKAYLNKCDGQYVKPTTVNSIFKHTENNRYWSSTSNSYYGNDAWYIYFNLGFVESGNKFYTGFIRLVRDNG